jgi:hypothetical protein
MLTAAWNKLAGRTVRDPVGILRAMWEVPWDEKRLIRLKTTYLPSKIEMEGKMTEKEKAEVIELIRREMASTAEFKDKPIEIWDSQPKSEDIKDKTVVLEKVKTIKDYVVWAMKKFGKIIKIIAFPVTLYNLIYLSAQFLFPNTLPSAQQLAVIAGEKTRTVISQLVPDKSYENFYVYSPSWLKASNNSDFTHIVRDASRSPESLLGTNDLQIMPASGVVNIGNIPYSTSGSNA